MRLPGKAVRGSGGLEHARQQSIAHHHARAHDARAASCALRLRVGSGHLVVVVVVVVRVRQVGSMRGAACAEQVVEPAARPPHGARTRKKRGTRTRARDGARDVSDRRRERRAPRKALHGQVHAAADTAQRARARAARQQQHLPLLQLPRTRAAVQQHSTQERGNRGGEQQAAKSRERRQRARDEGGRRKEGEGDLQLAVPTSEPSSNWSSASPEGVPTWRHMPPVMRAPPHPRRTPLAPSPPCKLAATHQSWEAAGVLADAR